MPLVAYVIQNIGRRAEKMASILKLSQSVAKLSKNTNVTKVKYYSSIP